MKARGKITLLVAFLIHFGVVAVAQKVTFRQKNASLKEIFKAIEAKTGYSLVWSSISVDDYKLENVEFQNTPLKEVLDRCLLNLPFRYEIQDKIIVIKDRKERSVVIEKLTEGQINVRGQITDKTGVPLSYATIKVSGGPRTVLSSSNGYFKLDHVREGTSLLVSFLGYKELVVPATEDMGIITLSDSIGLLNSIKVLSTGYQQIKKGQVTGSIAYIKGADLVNNGSSTLEQMLQGRITGVEVVNSSGEIGRRQSVKVRGVSTLLGNQEPVWVVDGIIQEDPLPYKPFEIKQYNQTTSNTELLNSYIGGPISGVNPFDIQDIIVLKDAASTAIYGVKAANGVIVINTKKGKIDQPIRVSYLSNFSLQERPDYNGMNMMNSKERIDISREIWDRGLVSSWPLDDYGYSGLLKQFLLKEKSYDGFNEGIRQLETNNTDWFDLLFKNTISQNHNIALSGGSSRNTYYGSLGYVNKQGAAKGNDMKSYLASINFTSYISSRLSVSAKISGNYSRSAGFFETDPYEYASTTSRVLQPYNTDGSLSYYKKNGYNFNILNELAHTGNNAVKTDFNSLVSLSYAFSSGFRLESLLGLGYSDTEAASYASELTNRISIRRRYEYAEFDSNSIQYRSSPLPYGGELATVDDRNSNYTWRNNLKYDIKFKEKHAFSALFGFEFRSNHYDGSAKTIFGYMPEQGGITINPPAAVLNIAGTVSKNDLYTYGFKFDKIDRTSNYVSSYLNGAYTYDNRYVFTVSLRGDASNRFGTDRRTRFNPIWAVGGKWINDKFSLRASYGIQGNVAESFSPSLIISNPSGAAAYSSVTGERILEIGTLPYADLRWEKTQTLNLGVDISLLKNRISGSLDYYSKNGKDIVVQRVLPYENGVTSMPANGGTLSNQGFEVMLSIIPIMTKNLNWSITLNTARTFNKVTSKLQSSSSWNDARSGNYFVQGYPVSAFWVFDLKGLDHSTGVPVYNMPTAVENPDIKLDAAAYMKYGGNLNADFTGGLNNMVTYKQFTFSMNLYASLGGHKLLAPLYGVEIANAAPNEYNNFSKVLNERWRKPGDELLTNVPALPSQGVPFVRLPEEITLSPYSMYNYSSARVINTSYLRINNVNFYYLLPEKFSEIISCKKISIGYCLSNAYTFASKELNGIDPEVSSGNQPLLRTHTLNVSATF